MPNDVIISIKHKLKKLLSLLSHEYREEEQNQMLTNACNSVIESEQVKIEKKILDIHGQYFQFMIKKT
jgi:hypothetical protein